MADLLSVFMIACRAPPLDFITDIFWEVVENMLGISFVLFVQHQESFSRFVLYQILSISSCVEVGCYY